MLDTTLNARIQSFLDNFDAALAAGDIDAAVQMFAPECYWRDLVAFTWNIKTMEGRDQVREMLSACLGRAKPRNWKIAEGESATETDGVTECWISFETGAARGYGLIRLRNGQIWTLLTTLVELKDHEEKAGYTRPFGARHGVNPGAKSLLATLSLWQRMEISGATFWLYLEKALVPINLTPMYHGWVDTSATTHTALPGILLVVTIGDTGKRFALDQLSSIATNMVEMQFGGGTVPHCTLVRSG